MKMLLKPILSSENDVFMLGGVAPYMNVSFWKVSSVSG
jgi:hypothetical protein